MSLLLERSCRHDEDDGTDLCYDLLLNLDGPLMNVAHSRCRGI